MHGTDRRLRPELGEGGRQTHRDVNDPTAPGGTRREEILDATQRTAVGVAETPSTVGVAYPGTGVTPEVLELQHRLKRAQGTEVIGDLSHGCTIVELPDGFRTADAHLDVKTDGERISVGYHSVTHGELRVISFRDFPGHVSIEARGHDELDGECVFTTIELNAEQALRLAGEIIEAHQRTAAG